jgi:hydrogenase maturation protease
VHLVRGPLPEAGGKKILKVVGIGNQLRGDDAVGLHVARRLRGALPVSVEVVEHQGEPTGLMDSWEGAEAVWLVDAVSSGAKPGTVHRLDVSEGELPSQLFRASTHHIGLAEVVELARALRRLPRRVVVYGVEGARFDARQGLTSDVEAAVELVVESLRKEVAHCARTP